MSQQYFDLAMYQDTEFHLVYHWLRACLLDAPKVDVGEWHAMNTKGNPLLVSRELRGVTFHTQMPLTMDGAQLVYEPNLPWAEDQFQERVAGQPVNPGETYMYWPWQSKMSDHQKAAQGEFSHTYMERYYPKRAGLMGCMDFHCLEHRSHRGIRYQYGDLDDVISMLARSPLTRQAVLPVWFPEDTGAVENQRVPCSLTYQFLVRDNKLHCVYNIRSCDFVRHFRDDVYMTVRLVQHVLDKLKDLEVQNDPAGHAEHGGFWTGGDAWEGIEVGTLTMQIGSLHIFEGDVGRMEREIEKEDEDRDAALYKALG